MRGLRLGSSLALVLGLVAAACGGEESSVRPPPEDEVIDESAGEEALDVLQGNAPGVALIVEYPEGTEVDSLTEALSADFDLTITSRYHDLLLGAAFIAPDEETATAIAADPRVLAVSRDRILALPDTEDATMSAEVSAEYIAAQAAGEVEAEGAEEGGADEEFPFVFDIRPQKPSFGWKLIQGQNAPGNGKGMLVAVLDSGIDLNHPDLEAAIHKTLGKDCVRRTDKTIQDLHGHGTHVAGIIAAQDNNFGTVGIAPKATLISVRIFDNKNFTTASSTLCGLDYVARRTQTIDAVNLSIQGLCDGPCDASKIPEAAAIKKLIRRDVFVAICAGNHGVDARNEFLGFVREAVTVSAYLDWNGKLGSTDRFANFSGFGSVVDIGAPGTGVMSPTINKRGNPGYQRKNGCSMATPFVTGAAVVYKQAFGGNPGRIRSMLLRDARTDYPGRNERHDEPLLLMREASSTPTPGGDGCGDGVCAGDESDASCGEDCGCGAAVDCGIAPYGCYCDPACAASGDCCADAAAVCPGG